MLRMNGYLNGVSGGMLTGLAPTQNSLRFFGWAALRKGGVGRFVSVPRGYGMKGMAPCMKAGSASSSPNAGNALEFSGSAPINKGVGIAASGPAFTLGGSAALGAIVRMLASGAVLEFSGSAGIYGVASMNASGTAINFTGSALLGGLFNILASGAALQFGGSATTHSLAHLVTTEASGEMNEQTIAAAVWSNVLGGSVSAEDAMLAAGSAGDPWVGIIDGMTAGDMLSLIRTLTDELHKLQGLDAATPVTHTPGSITADSIAIDLSGDGVNSRTKTRRAG